MEKLNKLIQKLENEIPNQEVINTSISKSSVGWHIEHTLLTINLVIEAVLKSDPNNYKWTFNIKRMLVFTMNKIPRGKAKSPKVVQPKIDFNIETIKLNLEKGKTNLTNLQTLSENKYFDHPYFAQLNLKQTIKFLEIHTNHHLKIINDIIKSKI